MHRRIPPWPAVDPATPDAPTGPQRAQTTPGRQRDHALRAGVESTIAPATAIGARRASYRGLGRTRLEHTSMDTRPCNLIRLDA
ncbi:hypothetical protein ABT297_30785 [Dactylosporangium sp. NPDC000555]|uniref:hypothetical protein n=1 Tax=Dactylosporangium sp. NPDC000555 TaxID=3154260 RepID=UPI003330BFFD